MQHFLQVDLDASAAQLQASEAQAQVQALASENQQLRAALVEGLQACPVGLTVSMAKLCKLMRTCSPCAHRLAMPAACS